MLQWLLLHRSKIHQFYYSIEMMLIHPLDVSLWLVAWSTSCRRPGSHLLPQKPLQGYLHHRDPKLGWMHQMEMKEERDERKLDHHPVDWRRALPSLSQQLSPAASLMMEMERDGDAAHWEPSQKFQLLLQKLVHFESTLQLKFWLSSSENLPFFWYYVSELMG